MRILRLLSVLLLPIPPAVAHDMFLVVADHQLPANAPVTVALYNGTFEKSENSISRDRMIDVSVVDGAGVIEHPLAKQWRDVDNVSYLDFETGDAGTYLVGVSTAARMIELTAEDFNEYLAHDGVLDVLAARARDGALEQPARERYSKHVKTILQVGEVSTDAYLQVLGYPVEIVPQTHPGKLRPGDPLRVLVLADGRPAAGQLVHASHEGFLSHDDSGGHREAVQTRTGDNGIAEIEISASGRWYIRLIRMLPVAEEGVDYESNWATLTFEVP